MLRSSLSLAQNLAHTYTWHFHFEIRQSQEDDDAEDLHEALDHALALAQDGAGHREGRHHRRDRQQRPRPHERVQRLDNVVELTGKLNKSYLSIVIAFWTLLPKRRKALFLHIICTVFLVRSLNSLHYFNYMYLLYDISK